MFYQCFHPMFSPNYHFIHLSTNSGIKGANKYVDLDIVTASTLSGIGFKMYPEIIRNLAF